MIRTILWFAYFWAFMVLTLVLFIPYFFLLVLHKEEELERFVCFCSTVWARTMIWAAGGKVQVVGMENLPEHNNICFVSNHQSRLDGLQRKKEMICITGCRK